MPEITGLPQLLPELSSAVLREEGIEAYRAVAQVYVPYAAMGGFIPQRVAFDDQLRAVPGGLGGFLVEIEGVDYG